MENLIVTLGIIIALVFVFRLFGAWMLRINDVIRELKQINIELKKGNEGIVN